MDLLKNTDAQVTVPPAISSTQMREKHSIFWLGSEVPLPGPMLNGGSLQAPTNLHCYGPTTECIIGIDVLVCVHFN